MVHFVNLAHQIVIQMLLVQLLALHVVRVHNIIQFLLNVIFALKVHFRMMMVDVNHVHQEVIILVLVMFNALLVDQVCILIWEAIHVKHVVQVLIQMIMEPIVMLVQQTHSHHKLEQVHAYFVDQDLKLIRLKLDVICVKQILIQLVIILVNHVL